ncbi:MAG: PAS domain S-box protein [Actinomycetota bacterium]|nr:PAS domain S-box protein [Actinomycetota bacterium]
MSVAHRRVVSDVGAATHAGTTSLAVVMVAADGTVTSLSPAAERLLGCNATDVVGHAVTALGPKERRGELAITVERVLAGQDVAPYETLWGQAGGGDVLVELSLLALRAQPGRPLGVAVVVRDVTERHDAEKELARTQLEHEHLQLASDRERIGRDLHDLVIQRLFATGLLLQGVASFVEPPQAAQRISAAIDELDTVIGEIRTTIFALGHHRASSSPSLRDRILEVISEAARSLGYKPTVRLDGPVDAAVSDEIGDHLLAVLREAMSNVARHAHATRTSIVVHVEDGVVLRVTDNGTGMVEDTCASGLRNMRQRAEACGGTMEMTGVPTGGTSLDWQVPFAR